jgi:MFS transporter, YQGE family, putative transporter
MLKLKYFSNNLSPGFVALYSCRTIQFIGSNLIGLFLPIYLLTVFNLKLETVFYYYLITHLLYVLFLPIGAKLINRLGLNNSLRLSLLLFAIYFLCLYFLKYNLLGMSILALVVLTFARTFFWMPYHTDLAIFTDKKDRGKSISLLWATSTFLGVVMPVISGFLIGSFGYSLVFILAIFSYICAIFPLLALPPSHETYVWSYWQTFRQFLSRKNRKLMLANMANGAENEIGVVVWPIFIWQILAGNYLSVGAISSLIIFVTIALQLGAGTYADKFDKRRMMHWGSLFYAIGWLAKVFVLSATQIFFVGTYHSFAQIFKDTPFDTLNYELLADQGHYVDEYTVIKEIAVQLGKVLMLAFVIILIGSFSLNWTFALAALATLLVNFL